MIYRVFPKLAICAMLSATAPCAGMAIAATIQVRPGTDDAVIMRAVASAGPGDTVVVSAGTYAEHGIEIQVPLLIAGDGRAVVDAGGEGEIFTVRSSKVTVRGLELRNVGTSFMEDRAAIKIIDAVDCTVENNRIVNGFFGIYLENSQRCTVRQNMVTGMATREATSGNGVHLWHCREVTVVGNTVTGHRDGIYFEFVEDSRIAGNHSEGNLRYGLHFMFSHRNEYIDNAFIGNGAGVAVMYSSGVSMIDNRFEKNWGGAAYGLLLKEIKDSEIQGNRFQGNTIAVYSEGSNRVMVTDNDFVENGYAVKIMANSMDNRFSNNNFVGNTFDVSTNSRQNFNTFDANYWSDYRGYDLDGDGFGDIPYHPVRLFSLLVEREPSGVILMNSLFVSIIDAAERVMPAFTPETLVDERPLVEAVTFHGRS
jgi:nitrous oxidase accessory protein